MEKRRILLLAIALFIFLVIASILIFLEFAVENEYFTPSAGKPYNARIENIDEKKTQILVDVDICNPNSFDISFKKEMVNGVIYFNGEKIGKIGLLQPENIPGRAISTITMVAEINNRLLPDCLLSHIKNNEHSVIDIVLPINFTIGGVKFKTQYFNGTSSINTSILDTVDQELEKISLSFLFKVKDATSHWDISNEKIKFDSIINASCFPFLPIFPFNATLFANNIAIAQAYSSTRHYAFHRKNIEIGMTSCIQDENLDDFVSTLSDKISLKVEIAFKILRRELKYEKELEDYEINPTDFIGDMKFFMEEPEKKEVTNLPEVLAGILFIWILYGIFIVGLTRYFNRKERQKLL